jgi:hypothetical protein
MHGWFSLPILGQLLLLALAPVMGIVLGALIDSKRPNFARKLCTLTLVYTLFAVSIALMYEVGPQQIFSVLLVGLVSGSLLPWGVIFLLVYILALPTIGVSWLVASRFARWKRGPIHDKNSA